jgi:ERCC4-type nuclease
MFIHTDKRERVILAAAAGRPEFIAEHLTTGDFLIMIDECARLVVERKTWKDLAASIKDGRIENISKLKSYSADTGAKIAYIIEGRKPHKESSVANVPFKNLRAHLDHLMLRDDVIVVHTAGPEETIERLLDLARALVSLHKGQPKSDGHLARAKVTSPRDVAAECATAWRGLTGVGVKTAAGLMRVTSLQDAFTGKTEGTRTRSQVALLDRLKENADWKRRVLAAVPQFSAASANAVFEHLGEELKWDGLADVKINGRKLGQKRADRLREVFGFKLVMDGDPVIKASPSAGDSSRGSEGRGWWPSS